MFTSPPDVGFPESSVFGSLAPAEVLGGDIIQFSFLYSSVIVGVSALIWKLPTQVRQRREERGVSTREHHHSCLVQNKWMLAKTRRVEVV